MSTDIVKDVVDLTKTIIRTRDCKVNEDMTRHYITRLLFALNRNFQGTPMVAITVYKFLADDNHFNIRWMKTDTAFEFEQRYGRRMRTLDTVAQERIAALRDELFA